MKSKGGREALANGTMSRSPTTARARAKGVQIFINGRSPATRRSDNLGGRFRRRAISRRATKIGARHSKANSAICASITAAFIRAKPINGAVCNPVHSILQIARDRRTEDQTKWVRDYFLSEDW